MTAGLARLSVLISSLLYIAYVAGQDEFHYPDPSIGDIPEWLPNQIMKGLDRYAYPLLASGTAVSALNCTTEAFRQYLPANASVTFAYSQPANTTFHVPAGDIGYPTSPTGLDALCAVQIKVISSNTSAFSFGLFLPTEWNQRFLAVGNGGFIGGINWLDMGAGLGYGFAVMSTDTGHNSTNNGVWAGNNSEATTDWGYRAMHGSIVLAKQIVQGYYNKASEYSYYSGCSTGGRQGIRDIQLYPSDFDGVVAGAPAWWTTHLQTWTNKLGLYNLPNTSATHIPPALFTAIGAEVLRQCDGADGVLDNIISAPHQCDFQPEQLLCPANVSNQTLAGCLTNPQLDTLYKIYNDYVDVNQTFVFPHLDLGSEAQWPVLLSGSTGLPNALGYQYIQYFLGLGPDWDPEDFDYSIVELADRLDPGNATADDFDLSPFMNQGGKLLMYHGMADALIPTDSSTYFYRQVLRAMKPTGIDLDDFYRFFYVPGMQHCASTPTNVNAPWYFAGPNQAAVLGPSIHSVPGFGDARHDVLLSMMAWVENGTAPESIIATKWTNDTIRDEVYRQRPLCMFPKRAMWNGWGDIDKAENWGCV